MGATKAIEDWLRARRLDIINKFFLKGTEVTATAAELNALHGITADVNELNILDGVTASAAELNIMDGVTKTAAEINALVSGVAGGYKIARSAAPVALDGSNPTSVAHGLTTCVAAFVQLVGSSAPGDNTSILTCVINGANIDVYGWKNTGGTDPTLVASTGTETFNWFAIGT
jgi:hypothetical protein